MPYLQRMLGYEIEIEETTRSQRDPLEAHSVPQAQYPVAGIESAKMYTVHTISSGPIRLDGAKGDSDSELPVKDQCNVKQLIDDGPMPGKDLSTKNQQWHSYGNAQATVLIAKKDTNQHSNSYYFRQLQDVFQHIDENDYSQEPERQKITDEAINDKLKALDPYSRYYTDEDLELFLSQDDGGIAVETNISDSGAIRVITPIDDFSSHKASIGAGDYIVDVNGQLVSNVGVNKAMPEMRGESRTVLNLLVTKEIEIEREIVKNMPIKFEVEEDKIGGIGYIRIVEFIDQTSTELKKAVVAIEKRLKQKNKTLKGLILDIRNNPGGWFDQAVEVCEYFIDHGVIVSTRGRNGNNDSVTSASRFVPKAPKVPIVVLINADTASAAEIVAGALQDHKRAIIVGTESFGKGLVQTFIRISSRAAVSLTTEEWYTPSGKCINAEGIQPDLFIENAKVEHTEMGKRETSFTSCSVKSYLKKYNTDEKSDDMVKKKNKEVKEHIMSQKCKKDYQYARAYDIIRGLIISHANYAAHE